MSAPDPPLSTPPDPPLTTLLPQHAELIAKSAISNAIAAERGYWTATNARQLERLFGPTQRKLVPALVIPTYDVHGNVAFCQLRPDEPRVVKAKSLKYEIPAGARMAVDVPPRVRPVLGNPAVPLVITEGARKADAAVTAGLYAVDLIGVWTWRGRNGDGGLTALADFESIALNGRVVYLAFDSDAITKREVYGALARFTPFLRKRGADVRIIYLPSGDGGAKTGLDDYFAAGHSRDDALALSVDELRPFGGASINGKPKPEPPEVDGAELLGDIRAFITRYMVLPSKQVADLLALWILHTWAFDAAWATPYLRVTSATAASGKTLLLEILHALCRHAWHAINPSTAVLYRKIDQQTPTLLLDEMDNYPVDDRRDALAVLNAGYKRGATVDRCTESGELVEFHCFCPKAYAGIDSKALADTLLSRSITIRLERKTATESVDMWIAPLTTPLTEPISERCAAWAHHNVDALQGARPELVLGLPDRATEVWWALLAIADWVGGDWPTRARAAARELSAGGDKHDESSDAVTLLTDIRDAFGDEQAIFTKDLLGKLLALDESPWGARRRGEGLDGRGLSRMLRPFKIRPKDIRIGDEKAKGYHWDQFADAFSRYLSDPSTAATNATSETTTPQSHANVSDVSDVAANPGGAHERDDDALTLAEPAGGRDHHRHSDWAMPNVTTGVCGVCHPPPETLHARVQWLVREAAS